jgi:hypothetical protein
MTTILTDDDLKRVRERLHEGYITALAAEIRAAVGGKGRPLAVAYEPGDMTRYVLVFTPLDLSPVTERAHVRCGWPFQGEDPAAVIQEPRGVDTGLGVGEPDGRFALVALVDHGAYPFELFGPGAGFFDPGYVGGKLGIRSAVSAVAVAALLDAVVRV